MKKKIISLFLALTVLRSLIPAVRAEEQREQEIMAMVAEQLDAFAKTLNPSGASEGAAQLVKNYIAGGGNLKMTEQMILEKRKLLLCSRSLDGGEGHHKRHL